MVTSSQGVQADSLGGRAVVFIGLRLMMEIGHDERLGLTGQVMLWGVRREQKGLKTPRRLNHRCAASTGAQGRRNAESCGRCFSRLCSLMCTSEDPRALEITGPAWERDWTKPARANVAQQKGWEKQKAPQGQNPQARRTLGMEIVQDSQNLDHAVWNTQHSLPTASSLTLSPPLPQEGLTKRWICLPYH